jgi:hypothetical protein
VMTPSAPTRTPRERWSGCRPDRSPRLTLRACLRSSRCPAPQGRHAAEARATRRSRR